MPPKLLHLGIELEVDETHLAGRVSDSSGVERPFSGWLGLIGALDALVGAEAAPAALPTATPPPQTDGRSEPAP